MWGVWTLDEDSWKQIVCKYWGYISLIDDAIGHFIDYLQSRDLYNEMFVVLSADHGDAMGAHRMIEKGEFMFDQTYRVPLVIKDPNAAKPNARSDEMVYLHDVSATYAELDQAKYLTHSTGDLYCHCLEISLSVHVRVFSPSKMVTLPLPTTNVAHNNT